MFRVLPGEELLPAVEQVEELPTVYFVEGYVDLHILVLRRVDFLEDVFGSQSVQSLHLLLLVADHCVGFAAAWDENWGTSLSVGETSDFGSLEGGIDQWTDNFGVDLGEESLRVGCRTSRRRCRRT